jgi:Leucine-rich repeat (LRR) protein
MHMLAVLLWSNALSMISVGNSQNQCNPTKGCNVCSNCCKSYIPDGPQCDNCVLQECGCKGASSLLNSDQCTIWQEFFDINNGTGWIYCNDNRDDPCGCAAHSYGVGCENNDITRIYLVGNHLSGSIPQNLSSLTALKYLALQINQLTGTIPHQLSRLSSLTTLALDCNNLSGVVPELPWSQYTDACYIGGPKDPYACRQFAGNIPNQFSCPLPPGIPAKCGASCHTGPSPSP